MSFGRPTAHLPAADAAAATPEGSGESPLTGAKRRRPSDIEDDAASAAAAPSEAARFPAAGAVPGSAGGIEAQAERQPTSQQPQAAGASEGTAAAGAAPRFLDPQTLFSTLPDGSKRRRRSSGFGDDDGDDDSVDEAGVAAAVDAGTGAGSRDATGATSGTAAPASGPVSSVNGDGFRAPTPVASGSLDSCAEAGSAAFEAPTVAAGPAVQRTGSGGSVVGGAGAAGGKAKLTFVIKSSKL